MVVNQEQMAGLDVGDSYQTIPRRAGFSGPPDILTVEVVKTSAATIWWRYQGSETVQKCRRASAYSSMPRAASDGQVAEARLKLRVYKLFNLIESAVKAARESEDVATLEAVWAAIDARKATVWAVLEGSKAKS